MCLLQENPPDADLGGQVHTEQGEVPGGSAVPFTVTSFFHQEDVVRGWVKLPPVGTKLFNHSSEWALGGGGIAGFHKCRQAQARPAK